MNWTKVPYRDSHDESENSKKSDMMLYEPMVQEMQRNANLVAETESDIKSKLKLKFWFILFIVFRVGRKDGRNKWYSKHGYSINYGARGSHTHSQGKR